MKPHRPIAVSRIARITLALAACLALCCFAHPTQAAITWTGDVDPNDPNTWTMDTTGTIGVFGDGAIAVDEGSDLLSKNCFIGLTDDSTGVVTIDGTDSTWTCYYWLYIGNSGSGSLAITDGGSASITYYGFGVIGNNEGSTGQLTVDGAGSSWSSNDLWIGYHGKGTLAVTNGGTVVSGYGKIGAQAGPPNEATVDGFGSTWICDKLWVGELGSGTLTITNGGLVSVAEHLFLDSFGSFGDSYINMATGGMLAIAGDKDDSLSQFLSMSSVNDVIYYWDDGLSDWSDISTATPGVDYTLEYLNSGDLAGYTVLTVGAVPEPAAASLLLLAVAGVLLRRERL